MNLFRKVIATIALITMAVSTGAPSVGAYSTAALDAAEDLAAKGVINAQSNADDYRLDQNILRQEVAKVAVNIAESVEVKSTCDGSFDDVTATTPNDWVCGYAEALLDAGLISANANFNPEANITKAETVKMMLEAAGFTDIYTDVNNWQEEVVATAVAEGVLSASFTDYNTPATRGFVFEMGSNAMAAMSDGGDDILCELLGTCDTGDTGTGDTGDTGTGDTGDTGTTGSSLMVELNPSSLADGSQIPNVGVVRFAVVDFTAGSEDASINTVELTKKTLASVPSGTRVWFEKDGKRISGKSAFSSDNVAIISFAPAYVVRAGETESLDLYVELPTGTAAGNDFQFMGEVTDASVSVEGDFVTPLLTTATYTVAPVVFNALTGSTVTYNDLENPVELAKFTLQNADTSPETRDVELQSITLRQIGDADLANLSDVYLERNGEKVSTEATVDGKYVTFVVGDVIKDGTTATYYVRGLVSTVDNNSGDTYQFQLKKDTDLNVVEVTNGFRSSVYTVYSDDNNSNNDIKANAVDLRVYTVNGSDVVFERDDTVELSNNVAKGTNNVTLMKGVIKTTSAVTLEDPTLNFTISGGATPDQLFSTVYLKIGSTTMTWTPSAGDTSAAFLGLATLQSGETPVEIYANVKDSSPTTTFKFDDLRLSSFATAEYTENQNTVSSSVGTVAGVSVSIDNTVLTATKVDGLGDTTIAAGSKNVVLNTLSLKVTQGNPVSISNPTYTVTYSGSAQNNVFLTLYADGTAVTTKTLNVASGGTITFQNLSEVVDETPVELTVKADLSDAFTGGTLSVKLTGLDATDTLTSNTVSLPSIANSAVFSVAQAVGELAESDNNPDPALLLAGSTGERLLAFRVKARNDDVRLRDLVFTGTNLDALNNFRVEDADGNVVASSTSENATQVDFTNLNTSYVISQDSTETYYLVADVNLNTSNKTVDVVLDGTQSNIKGSNGTTIAMTGVPSVTSNTHRVEENLAVVAKDSNSSKEIATSALRFSVTATGKDQATLSGVTLDISLSGYVGATQIAVYKDSISNNNLLGTGAVASGTISFNNLKTVDAGSTNHYLIAIEGAVVDSAANSNDWTVSLTDVIVDLGGTGGPVSAKDYDNMGTFPITETK